MHLLGSLDGGAVGIQVAHGLEGGGAGQDALGLLVQLPVEAVELAPAVGVRVGQFEVRAVPVPRPDSIAGFADGVGRALRAGPVTLDQEAPELRHRGGGRRRERGEARLLRLREAAHQLVEIGGGLALATPDGELLGGRLHLARRGEDAFGHAGLQRPPVLGPSLGGGGKTGGQRLPSLGRVRRGDVEHLAQLLRRRSDVVEGAQRLVALAEGDGGVEALAQQHPAATIALVAGEGGFCGVQVAKRGARQGGARVLPLGRMVGERVIVPEHAREGRSAGIEHPGGLRVAVGQLADGTHVRTRLTASTSRRSGPAARPHAP